MEFSDNTLDYEALLRFTRLVQNECDKSQEVHGQATQMGVNIMIAHAYHVCVSSSGYQKKTERQISLRNPHILYIYISICSLVDPYSLETSAVGFSESEAICDLQGAVQHVCHLTLPWWGGHRDVLGLVGCSEVSKLATWNAWC